MGMIREETEYDFLPVRLVVVERQDGEHVDLWEKDHG